MSWNEYGTEQDIYDDGYNRGRRDGYEEGMKDFDRKHAQIMAQYEAMVKMLAEFDLSRPHVVIVEQRNPDGSITKTIDRPMVAEWLSKQIPLDTKKDQE